MTTDRTTRLLLAAIATALWLDLVLPIFAPTPAVADSPVRTEITNEVRIRGEVKVTGGTMKIDMDKIELDTFHRPIRVELKQ